MTERTAIIRNANGIHCRPSALILQATKDYTGSLEITSDHGATDLRSVIGLIGLGLTQGLEVTIHVDGPDETAMADSLYELFERRFDFPPKSSR
ncbi:MAG TPA: HPr family phosphocarrier protein [Lentisphaeria bacterium]|jgi:phosphotransferase system HPr (HPr) family protein|nr:HPr family phosphocarrier protein [Lentisphaeria bacterium]